MTDPQPALASDPNSLRRVVHVEAPPDIAWRVFTQELASWWPLATHKIGEAKAVDAVIEPRVGGRWYERGDDGSSCDWGRVLAWEPPKRLVLSWEISADWTHDPSIQTEVEVRFVPTDDGATRVELEHRRLDAFGGRSHEMRGVFDSDGGWKGLLQAFARRAAER